MKNKPRSIRFLSHIAIMRVPTFVRQDEIDFARHFIRILTIFLFSFFTPCVTESAQENHARCEIYRSSTSPLEWAATAVDAFRSVTGLECVLIENTLDAPFDKSKRKTSSAVAFQLWIHKLERSDEVLLRLFEGESSVQWGSFRTRLTSVSSESLQLVLSDSVQHLLKLLPLVGLVDSEAVFYWGTKPDPRLLLVVQKAKKHHPFIPSVLDFEVEPISSTQFRLERSSTLSGFLLSPKPKLQSQKRLWLANAP